MRTALLETSAEKIDACGKNNILLLPKFVLSTMSHEIEHSESEFYYPGELSHAELLQSRTNSFRNQRKKFNTPRKWRSSQLSRKPTSKQAVKERTFPRDKLSNN